MCTVAGNRDGLRLLGAESFLFYRVVAAAPVPDEVEEILVEEERATGEWQGGQLAIRQHLEPKKLFFGVVPFVN